MTYTAIETKVLHPTNHRGARIKASEMDIAPSKNKPIALTKPWDYELDVEQNHQKVALELHDLVCPYLKAWNGIKDICNHIFTFGSTQKGYVMVSTLDSRELDFLGERLIDKMGREPIVR